jgi:hypothetical protein
MAKNRVVFKKYKEKWEGWVGNMMKHSVYDSWM